MTLGGGEFTKGEKRRLLTVPPPSQPRDLTPRTAPTMLENEVEGAPPRVQMDSNRMNVESSVNGIPAHNKLSGKASTNTTTSKGPA